MKSSLASKDSTTLTRGQFVWIQGDISPVEFWLADIEETEIGVTLIVKNIKRCDYLSSSSRSHCKSEAKVLIVSVTTTPRDPIQERKEVCYEHIEHFVQDAVEQGRRCTVELLQQARAI